LFINSKTGYAGDLVIANAELPCIPASPTGQSVISCSTIVRASQKQLRLFDAERVGAIPVETARKLHAFVESATTLTKAEKELVLAALANLI
jgi:hypothetical protein